jgi:DNA-binding XRE family transcriptional regulator
MAKKYLTEKQLAAAAKRFRREAGKTRAQAARDMGVTQTSVFHAEETPGHGLLRLRARMIAAYSPYKIIGPVFYLEQK